MKNLDSIIERVNIRSKELGENFNINQLRSIIRDLETPFDEFELPEYPSSNSPFARKQLYRDEVLELVLIRWRPLSESIIHDHGKSYGIVRVLSGVLNFQIYDSYLRDIGFGSVPAIDTFDLPQGIIHKMLNPSNYNEAISLHFYCPNIDDMCVYNIELREKQIIKNGTETWNQEDDDVVSIEKIPDLPGDEINDIANQD